MNLYLADEEAEVLLDLLHKAMNSNESDAYWDAYNIHTRIRNTQKEENA